MKLVECSVEKLPFAAGSYDAAVASHVLEHIANMGQALQEIRRVLKEDGWLLLFLPRYTDYVCAGHINTGWNLGQLIYVLLLNGFDVKNGRFIEYGYSLCAYVQKKDIVLPALRYDRGDIHILNKAGLWPAPIQKKGGIADGFSGDFHCLNWEHPEILEKKRDWKKKLLSQIARLLQGILGRRFCRALGNALIREPRAINPRELGDVYVKKEVQKRGLG